MNWAYYRSFLPHRQWLHLYRCNKSYFRDYSKLKFAEMCFECDTWFTDPGEWDLHCSEHLQQPETLLRCDPLMFRNAPIKGGLCPFCLGNKSLKPSRRVAQFVISAPDWHNHVESHLAGLNKFQCKYPACQIDFESRELLIYHLANAHCWSPRKITSHKRKHSLCT
jgi:carbonic anhydrase